MLLSFAPSARSKFNYDDSWTIVHNSALRSLAAYPDFLTGRAVREQRPDAWRPVMVLTLMLDYQLFGLTSAGFHLHSILWHLGCVLLLWLLCRRLWPDGSLALMAAAIFAVHPLHVEPVAAINYREDLLAAFFTLAALALIIPAAAPRCTPEDPPPLPAPPLWRLVVAAALVTLGLMAKATAAVAPLLYLCLLLMAFAGPWSQRIKGALPGFLATSAGLLIFIGWRIITAGSINPYPRMGIADALEGHGWGDSLATHTEVLVRTLFQLLIPLGLSAEYDQPTRSLLSAPGVASVVAVVALLILTGLLAVRRYRMEALGLALILIAWVPTSGIFSLPNLRADRYAYLPSIGVCILLAALVERLPGVYLRRSVFYSLLLCFCLLSFQHQLVWRSPLTLWSHAVERAPGSARAWSGLASARSSAGEFAEAERTARRAVALAARSGNEHMVLANILARQGKLQQALPQYQHAQDMRVRHPGILLANWGLALHLTGRQEEAEEKLRQAVRHDPNLARAHLNLGRVLMARGLGESALEALGRAAALDPENRLIRSLMARAREKQP